MATLALQKETATPPTPPAGFVRFYAEGAALKYIDESGTVFVISTGLTTEDVQDIVASIMVTSASINWNYNDASNTLTATVLASGVNHNALQNYVAGEHINHSSVSILAGTGLSGGGDITANRTLGIANTGVTAGTYGSSSTSAVVQVNAQGQVTGAASTAIALSSVSITDFAEAAQDAVGGSLVDSASVDFTYNDAANQVSAAVIPGGVNHNALQNFVASQHVDHTAVSISGGTGLTGGGDISASRVISLANTAVTPGVYGSAAAVPTITVDAQGRTTNAGNTPIAISSSQVTDFAEAVQDTMGGAITPSASVGWTYNDPANTQTATVLPAGVNHDALQNFVANKHIDHSAVSISAGTGLTGGGDLTANRTINLANTSVSAGSYGSSTLVALTIDAQGRVTSAADGPALALGDQFQRFEDLTTFTTTANTDQVAATFTTSTLPAGLYRIGSYWTFANSSNTQDCIFTWFLDGTQIGESYRWEINEAANQRVPWSVFLYPTITGNTTHTIELRARNEAAGNTLSVFNVQVELWRVN
jgi:phage-related tail fiber protein